MFTKKVVRAALLVVGAYTLAGCGGSGVESGTNDLLTCEVPNVPNSTGTACEPPPPIQCDAPLVPNEANDACEAGADPVYLHLYLPLHLIKLYFIIIGLLLTLITQVTMQLMKAGDYILGTMTSVMLMLTQTRIGPTVAFIAVSIQTMVRIGF